MARETTLKIEPEESDVMVEKCIQNNDLACKSDLWQFLSRFYLDFNAWLPKNSTMDSKTLGIIEL